MVSASRFRQMALSFPRASESPHFDKLAFRKDKKIFATLTPNGPLACVKLPSQQQSVFCMINKEMIYRVPNKWGLQGWTNIHLRRVTLTILRDLLRTAYENIDVRHAER